MLVYASDKAGFIDDVRFNEIDSKILAAFRRNLGRSTSESEIASWGNSMMYMSNILQDDEIPSDAGISIEYNLPRTNKRIDFIITGRDGDGGNNAIIVELKQWTEAKVTGKDGIVSTYLGKGEREMPHPSYQVWVYAALLEDFNEAVENEKIGLKPCAYLHNCVSDEVINSPFFGEYTSKAPAFLKKDARKLADFIKRYVKYGDSSKIMYLIDKGRIRPSRNLADKLDSLLRGNREFLMIDDQKIVFETALDLAERSTVKEKHVLIVEGGPGTGKSVVAVNLLVEFTKKLLLAQYVTKNAAPRDVYASKLSGSFTKTHINNLFRGAGSYTESGKNEFDVLVVDEAHRLNEKSGMFQNMGENQIKEIISASKFSVFFIDEDQRVTLKDIGEKGEIRKWAEGMGAHVHEMALLSQFRCNGSDSYLSWTDNALQIRETANESLVDYDFRVFDSPNELRDAIFERNQTGSSARMVAGYCWDWVSRGNDSVKDIIIEEHGFEMKWNLASDGNLWIVKPESVSEIGCIHTCQGLELDYVGVIIGPDFLVRNGIAVTDAAKRAKSDASIKGYKSLFKENPELAKRKADAIIKNTYRTLMTRGIKGCYLFCTDPETNAYFRELTPASSAEIAGDIGGGYEGDEGIHL
ncbi:MAG: DNA/RNA helicase domain-containing protein [Burkholderiales bacterium]